MIDVNDGTIVTNHLHFCSIKPTDISVDKGVLVSSVISGIIHLNGIGASVHRRFEYESSSEVLDSLNYFVLTGNCQVCS